MLNVRVSNTKLGPPFTGLVIGVSKGDDYSSRQNRILKRWDKLYPNWKNNDVLFVDLDIPGNIMRPDECESDEELCNIANLPKYKCLAIPDADATIL